MKLEHMETERVKHSMTQKAAAAAAGVSLRTYSNYVSGAKPVPSDVLIKLSALWGCRIDYLLGRTGGRERV